MARTVVAPLDRVKILQQTQRILLQQQAAASHAAAHSAAAVSSVATAARSCSSVPLEAFLSSTPSASAPRSPPPRPMQGCGHLQLHGTRELTRSLPQHMPGQTLRHSNTYTTTAAMFRQQQSSARGFIPSSAGVMALELPSIPAALSTSLAQRGQVVGDKYTAMVQTMRLISREEGGVRNLWRGNLTNILRVGPYSATQFATYDLLKSKVQAQAQAGSGSDLGSGSSAGAGKRPMTVLQRLGCGAAAGVVATAFTYPLDVIRLRQTVDPTLQGLRGATLQIWNEGQARALFKGFNATMYSLTPFIAINFAAFDGMKAAMESAARERRMQDALGEGAPAAWWMPSSPPGPLAVLSLGAASGLFAQTLCYPLDTVRRRMQLRGLTYPSVSSALVSIALQEGLQGFYKGMSANAAKVVPLAAIRFMCYEAAKKWIEEEKTAAAAV